MSEFVPIYRKCELALKRMGISVFWCLLPTMEMLTRRGIRLALICAKGPKVIESYPGAAQDILGIPRKRASLEELKWGLSRAGITGDFLTEHLPTTKWMRSHPLWSVFFTLQITTLRWHDNS